ncbi:SWIM zinc finger family protein [Catenulispora pinisilvae]|uniref:SWIM zinc finger family protein n=1 Tax=Catenulispora pinisilvae TaxID=2705253 RepID=UPI0018922BF2|nr:SWIM zinc finger family protein [Catenulispora pinisilvae]
MAERWTAAQVNSLAPDPAGQKAGAKLGVPGPWSGIGYLEDERLLWGDCKGSGSKPYQVTVSVADSDTAYQCTCPSRKFPCKHALGLLLLWAAGTVRDTEELPERVQAWSDSRKDRAEKSAARSVAKAEKAAADPEGVAKRAAQRAERIGNGLADLDRWLADQIAAGLSDPATLSYGAVDPVAKRLVDAQASGVAGRVRTLPGTRSAAGDAWPDAVLAEFSRLHLLCQAWTRLADLPPTMQDTVRRRIGISVDTDTVRRDGERVAGRWHVLGSRDRAAEKLTERRIWLRDAESGRLAMLLAFGAMQQAPTLALPVGAVYRAEMAFHSEALPLRAQMETGEVVTTDTAAAPAGGTLQAAAEEFAAALAVDPWQEGWPVVIADAVPDRTGELADAQGRRVPLISDETALWRLLAVSGGHPVTLFGEYTDAGLEPLTVWADGSAVGL